MKVLVIFLFSVFSGASLGALAGIGMAPDNFKDIAGLSGGGVGALYGAVGSLPFLWRRNHSHIFAILVICFVFAVPAAILSGYTSNPTLAAVVIALTIYTVLITSLRKASLDESHFLRVKSLFAIPLILVGLAGGAAFYYAPGPLPDDVDSLTELMGSNDQEIHLGAAHKLKRKFGKEPFLAALKHPNPNVRSVAVHFLSFFREPGVQEALISMASDSDPFVRKWVAYSLGQIGDKHAFLTLRDLAKDDQGMVRRSAEESIPELRRRTGSN